MIPNATKALMIGRRAGLDYVVTLEHDSVLPLVKRPILCLFPAHNYMAGRFLNQDARLSDEDIAPCPEPDESYTFRNRHNGTQT